MSPMLATTAPPAVAAEPSDVVLDGENRVAALEVFVTPPARDPMPAGGDLIMTFHAAARGQKWKERDRNVYRVRLR